MLLTRVRFPSPAPGLLAQLVRALPSHGRGRWFESSTAHHFETIPFFSESSFVLFQFDFIKFIHLGLCLVEFLHPLEHLCYGFEQRLGHIILHGGAGIEGAGQGDLFHHGYPLLHGNLTNHGGNPIGS